MVIDMNEAEVRTLDQVREVMAGTQALEFLPGADDAARYAWIESVLRRFNYRGLKRAERGVLLRYLHKLSGYSRAQLTRLVGRRVSGGSLLKRYRAPAHAFAQRYTPQDVALLVELDRAIGMLSGPATVCVLPRQYELFGGARFERPATISVGDCRQDQPAVLARIGFAQRIVQLAVGLVASMAAHLAYQRIHPGALVGFKIALGDAGAHESRPGDILAVFLVARNRLVVHEPCHARVASEGIHQLPFAFIAGLAYAGIGGRLRGVRQPLGKARLCLGRRFLEGISQIARGHAGLAHLGRHRLSKPGRHTLHRCRKGGIQLSGHREGKQGLHEGKAEGFDHCGTPVRAAWNPGMVRSGRVPA